MNAVDTNVLVRWITRDDALQSAIADRVMDTPTYISHGVLIELVWVLSGKTFGLDQAVITEILSGLMRLDRVTIPAEEDVLWAIERYAAGADFADMIHIAAARGHDRFQSFDKKLARLAGPDAPVPIETLR